jgi:uncharacterized protein YvpB
METDALIRKAIHHARRGNKKLAEKILRKIVNEYPDHANAWYYLAAVVKTREESIQCLKTTVKLNPDHLRAKQILDKLEAIPVQQGSTRHKIKWGIWVFLLCVIILFIAGGVFAFLSHQKGIIAQVPTPLSTSTNNSVLVITPTELILPISTETATKVVNFGTPTATSDYPQSVHIYEITGQKMRISLDCEANSASIFAGYFGVKIDEVDFFLLLPVSDDPDKGFVGDVHDEWGNLPPKGYGVYPSPVVKLMVKKGVAVKDVYGFTLENLKREIAAGRPVIVWVIGRVETGQPVEYISSDGEKNIVAKFEHTVLVIGYDPWSVTILDGDTIYTRPTDLFLSSWGALGNMAIIKSDN